MCNRRVHYELAFEEFLRSRGLPYVAVDEARKAIFGDVALKSFDFIVYSDVGPNLLVDVKGRKFPDATPAGRKASGKAWENWITRDDAEGLGDWQRVFGNDFLGVLVFAYWLQGPPSRAPFDDVHLIREKYYAFVAVNLEDYLTYAKVRSQRWQTLSIGSAEFATLARPVEALLESPPE